MNIRITLVVATRDSQTEATAEVPVGTTLQQGLVVCADEIATMHGPVQTVSTGVWGKIRPPHYVLREGDRIEWYRPLRADPKQARRARVNATAKRS